MLRVSSVSRPPTPIRADWRLFTSVWLSSPSVSASSAAALAEAPALSLNFTRLSAKASAAFPVRASTGASASTEPNSLAMVSVLPPVASATSLRTPAKPLLSRAAALNSMPSSAAISEASLVGFSSAVMAARMPVIASGVLVPVSAVMVAIAAAISSKPSPAAEAIGAKRPIELASSGIVVWPSWTAVKNVSANSPAWSADAPKAFRVLTRAVVVSPRSARPAIDSCSAALSSSSESL